MKKLVYVSAVTDVIQAKTLIADLRTYIKSDAQIVSEMKQKDIDPAVLARLAEDDDNVSRWLASVHRNTPPDALAKLVYDRDKDVRRCVAKNSNTPGDALAILADDPDMNTRRFVAFNKNTPKYILEEMLEDDDKFVRQGAQRSLS